MCGRAERPSIAFVATMVASISHGSAESGLAFANCKQRRAKTQQTGYKCHGVIGTRPECREHLLDFELTILVSSACLIASVRHYTQFTPSPNCRNHALEARGGVCADTRASMSATCTSLRSLHIALKVGLFHNDGDETILKTTTIRITTDTRELEGAMALRAQSWSAERLCHCQPAAAALWCR